MASRDDDFWHGVMTSLATEYLERAAWCEATGKTEQAIGWREAAQELKATADQALWTNTTAERLVNESKKP